MSEKATKAAESTETKPSILFIVGSLRKQSLNGQLAQVARTALGERATTSELAWADVPVFSQDIEFPAPEAVRRVRKAVADADALWIVSPEYNHGVPGGLKNLIRTRGRSSRARWPRSARWQEAPAAATRRRPFSPPSTS